MSNMQVYHNAITAGTWSTAIDNNVLAATESTSQCNIAVGTENLQNLTTSSFNTAIGQKSSTKIKTGGKNKKQLQSSHRGLNSINLPYIWQKLRKMTI